MSARSWEPILDLVNPGNLRGSNPDASRDGECSQAGQPLPSCRDFADHAVLRNHPLHALSCIQDPDRATVG